MQAFGNIVIPSDITLTITSILECDYDVSIIIHPRGKLIINGGTLTNACPNQMWQGITVIGDPDPNVHPNNQSAVQVINGGKIENAQVGILATQNGRVTTNNAVFLNNAMSVQIEPAQTTSHTLSETIFIIDDDFLGNLLDFEAHIKLTDCKLVTVTGCTLVNAAGIKSSDNYGILAFNAPLTVKEYCPPAPACAVSLQTGMCDENCMKISAFAGFNCAISASTSGTTPVLKVRCSDFTDNWCGIRINGINNHELIRNTFFLAQTGSRGIFVTDATGYKIEENRFNAFSSAQNNITTGLLIRNSGIAENEVYKNEFTNLYAGQNFLCINGAVLSLNGTYPGLQALCNTFNNNQYRDIHVGDLTPRISCTWHSIRNLQGSILEPAGNRFNGTPILNIDNAQSPISMNYYCRNTNNEYPANVSSNVTRILTTSVNTCPSKIGIIGPGGNTKSGEALAQYLVQYDEWNAQYEYWLAKANKICGNNGENFGLPTDDERGMNEECAVILGMASHYSALKDNYFNAIIVAAMNNYEIEQEEGDEIKGFARNDEGGSEGWGSLYENLRFLFKYRGHYTDYLSITETFLAENNFTQALETLATMYKQFKLTEEQISELKGLEFYTRWLLRLEESGTNIYALSSTEIDNLINYAETNTGRGVVFANNILCELYGICSEKEERSRENGETEAEDEKQKTEINKSSELETRTQKSETIIIYPNPGKDYITVVSEVENSLFELIDAIGTVQKSVRLRQGNNTINTSSLPQGIYIYKVVTNDKIVTGKWLKM